MGSCSGQCHSVSAGVCYDVISFKGVELMDQQAIINYWSSFKETIENICNGYDSLWQKRNRILNSKLIVMMIFKLTLSDKHKGLSLNLSEFWDRCGEKNIDLPQPKAIAASSFCEARQKVPENIFTDLNQALLENWAEKKTSSSLAWPPRLCRRWVTG